MQLELAVRRLGFDERSLNDTVGALRERLAVCATGLSNVVPSLTHRSSQPAGRRNDSDILGLPCGGQKRHNPITPIEYL